MRAKIIEILDTSKEYITTSRMITRNDDYGIRMELENGVIAVVSILKNEDNLSLDEAKALLKDKGIYVGKEFDVDLDKTEELVPTTGYKQNVPGNVDKVVVHTGRIRFANRVRKGLTGKSRKLKTS